MDERRALLVDPVSDQAPTVRRVASGFKATVGEQLTLGWSILLGVGWPLAFMIAVALEPVPADPEAASGPVLAELAGLALLVALGATVVGAARRHPLAAPAAVVTGLLAVAFSITCPVSGHHHVGVWWFAQMGVVLAMLAASVVATGHQARATPS